MDDPLPRKLAVILYADVAGYSLLTGSDEDGTHRTLRRYLDLVTATIESHRGRVMHFAGDAVLARFDAVVDAVSGAIAIQKLLAERNRDLAKDRRVEFRIGLNLGDIIEDRGDLYGDGVNVAARLESLAEPGGICISESVRTALGKRLGLDYVDLGEQAVKNILEPVKAFAIRTTTTPVPQQPATRSERGKPDDRPTLAVLPFRNLNPENDDDYLAAGIGEEIMTTLGRYREIVVTALRSTQLVDEQKLDAQETAKKLGVRYLLNGSVRKSGDRVRVAASLVDGERGRQIWSEQYDHGMADIFGLQEEVAQMIVTMLVGKIEQADRERSLQKDTDNLTAYDCVLRGRYHFNDWQGSKDDVRQARAMFEKATQLDPRYAAAYAGLAATYLEEFEHRWSDDPDSAGQKCLQMARRAVELDDNDSFAHLLLSAAYWKVKSNFDLARSQLEAAIRLNPNHYWNYCYGSWFSAGYGDMDASISQAREAIRRNPLLPDSCRISLGFSEYFSRRYENAIATISRITRLEPESYACLAASYAQLGRVDEARTAARDCVEDPEDCVKSEAEWRAYWSDYLNIKDQAHIDHLIEGLDKAGLVSH